MGRSRHDVDTRRRLLAAGARLFADHGYAHVTIRDICDAAQANIAAVNYYFAGKDGLYDHVVQLAIATMQGVTAEAERAGERRNADDRLRAYVRVFLTRIAAADVGWTHHLMMREMSEPTEALERIVTDVVRPRMTYLSGIVAELLTCPADDPRVSRCVFSIHAQCLAMTHSPIVDPLNPTSVGAGDVPTMADHITEFSLAGLWALARST